MPNDPPPPKPREFPPNLKGPMHAHWYGWNRPLYGEDDCEGRAKPSLPTVKWLEKPEID